MKIEDCNYFVCGHQSFFYVLLLILFFFIVIYYYKKSLSFLKIIEVSKKTINEKAGKTINGSAFGACLYKKSFLNIFSQIWSFIVYSPSAENIVIEISNCPYFERFVSFKMVKKDLGVWYIFISGNMEGLYYRYFLPDKNIRVSDPFAKACFSNSGPSIVKDVTKIRRIHKEYVPGIENIDNLIVYETHVVDFTAHVGTALLNKLKGKFLGLRAYKKGIDHLLKLGITAVELMPVQQFDENFAGHVNHWGYMTSHFFAPHHKYSVNVKKGPEELAGLIDFLHRKNIKVILDVVFNHTAEGNENGPVINFKGLNNEGYYRLTGKSNEFYMNGSGCGNEFRSDCLTTGQYIIECLKFWVDVYKIDGFRFDLAASIDSDTLQRIRAELPENILLIAEPWTADWERKLWTKGFLKDKGWSNWNDDYKRDIRNFLLKKDLPFDKVIDGLITSLGGTCHYGWVSTPRESVNYVECHDNDTVADLFNNNQRCLKMAGFCLLTSRGIPMIHQGQEFGKNKMGNTNSYDQNNEINWLNWELKNKNMELFNFYSGLIKLRHEIPELKELKPFDPDYISWKRFDSLKGLLINIKRENDLIILYNGNHLKNSFIEFPLPQGIWIVLCDGERIDLRGIDKAEKSYSLPYMSGAVLKRYKEI